ncbi:GerMN domain-containing protein [Streptomyces sp. AV19]|uniref:LpqB family beta-propeller domain-containing protein n=1 Tax=Streptomyces sp. AV19 TaxID=2793068 RepID=UPI0018FE2C44|nr:LpqB family beta-propeller domain-containing protein [Streptomyces sp. AV19]MBH1932725.1 GerMN domain-containing protein [Streptomyces sp. AV19]MDG4531397.1 LpqB family beta-propeller domain-containing protein [Streptomyces sp. AV19]
MNSGAGCRRPGVALLVAVVCGGLLAGCASMPDSGEVDSVDSSQRADADAQVRVYGVPPRKNEQPGELVKGFLEATTSDESDYVTARMYLAKHARRQWNPTASTTVLSEIPQVQVEAGGGDRDAGLTVTLTGKQVAQVDAQHAYRPDARSYRQRIHLTREDGEWRIDALPTGLVVGLSDFQRIYRSVNKFYFADPVPGVGGKARDVLVADPVYLRKRIDTVTSAVKALLDGPTTWLDPVAASAFPAGTRLEDERLSLDDSNSLKVRLSAPAEKAGQDQCLRMAAQLFYTAQESARVDRVTLQSKDETLCSLSRGDARAYGPDQTAGRPDRQYFLDEQHRLAGLADGDEEPRRVPGPFGADGGLQLRSVAVDRAERRAAGVSLNGQALHVADLEAGASPGEARLTVRGGSKYGLTTPSWALGDLWVADQDPDRPRLLRLRGGTGAPEEVPVDGLKGQRITGVRVAADGVRIALLVADGDRSVLRLGRVERQGSGGLSVRELRSVAPKLVDVDAVSWAGGSRLLVAGSEQGGLQQVEFIDTDGSLSSTSALPGITGVGGVAAPEGAGKAQAVLAERDGGIVRLLPDTNWKPVAKGSAPVYPG